MRICLRYALAGVAALAVGVSMSLGAPEVLASAATCPPAGAPAGSICIKTSQVPVTASNFANTGSCTYPGLSDIPSEWGWHLLLPGNSATFVTLTATFANAGTVTLTATSPKTVGGFVQGGSGAVIFTPTDDTLMLPTWAQINGTTSQNYFVLSHVCPPSGAATTTSTKITPAPTPTPTPAPTSTDPTAAPTPALQVFGSGVQGTTAANSQVDAAAIPVPDTGTARYSGGLLLLSAGLLLISLAAYPRHCRTGRRGYLGKDSSV